MMGGWLAIALGGALGALGRYVISQALVSDRPFPWPTLLINLAGCLGIGLAWGSWSHLHWFQEWGRLFLVVGLLGGFTTFSTFSIETILLMHSNRLDLALTYVALSLVGCTLAAWLGHRLAEF